MDLEASYLLQQIKDEQRHVSDRMHRDARRQTLLKRASLMLGTGISAASVKDWMAGQHVALPITKKARLAYDTYSRSAPGASGQ